MACMCGDLYCRSCGPAQGNGYCEACGAWASDGGCKNPEKCKQEEAARLDAWVTEQLEMRQLADKYIGETT